jgi:hypothetical protein
MPAPAQSVPGKTESTGARKVSPAQRNTAASIDVGEMAERAPKLDLEPSAAAISANELAKEISNTATSLWQLQVTPVIPRLINKKLFR